MAESKVLNAAKAYAAHGRDNNSLNRFNTITSVSYYITGVGRSQSASRNGAYQKNFVSAVAGSVFMWYNR